MGPATTAVYTYVHPLSLHDALPICRGALRQEERPMNTIDHRAYFARRAAQERRLADAAADCTARHAHREMARCYADLALEAPRVEWPVQSDSIVLSPRAASAGASARSDGSRRVKTAIPSREAGHY